MEHIQSRRPKSRPLLFSFLLLIGVLITVLLWLIVGLSPLVFLSQGNTTVWNFFPRLTDVVRGWHRHKDILKDSGTFGDTFGFANALFSGLAFVGVAIAIVYQRLQLHDQREELELAKTELWENAQAQKKLERRSLLTSNLDAANSLAQSYAQTIEITQRFGSKIGTKAARSLIAEKRMRKYRQLQEILLFEINNFEKFYNERREVLCLKTKKEFIGGFIRATLPEWNYLLKQYLEMDSQRLPEKYSFVEESFHFASFIHADCAIFILQEGVEQANFRHHFEAQLQSLLDFISSGFDPGDETAVRSHFERGSVIISQLDISFFPD